MIGCFRHNGRFIDCQMGRSLFDSVVGKFILGKPGLGPGLDGGNLLRTIVSIQLVLQQLLKQIVKAEPSVFRVQGDQEKVALLESGDKLVAIYVVSARGGSRSFQRIAKGCAESIKDGRRGQVLPFAIYPMATIYLISVFVVYLTKIVGTRQENLHFRHLANIVDIIRKIELNPLFTEARPPRTRLVVPPPL